jgi:hypothetical protein
LAFSSEKAIFVDAQLVQHFIEEDIKSPKSPWVSFDYFKRFCTGALGFEMELLPRGKVLTGKCPVSPALEGGVKGHNIKGKYLTGKPRPSGRGASVFL